MSEALSMAVIGYGHFGKYHAEKVAASPRARLAAVADVDPGRAAEATHTLGVESVTDYRALAGAVDCVSVAVPTFAHCEVASYFLENGADVLVEKPITEDLNSAQRLVDLAKSKGRILQVGHLERFSGMIEALRKQVRRPLYIDSVRIAPFKPRGTDVNVILDLMIHDLDLILSFVDAPILSIDAAGAPVFSPSEDIAGARLKFANGCIANIAASRISLKTERRMRIFQPDTYVTVDFDKRSIRTIRKPQGKGVLAIPNIDVVEEDYQDGDSLEREIESFLTAVAERQRPIVSGEDGLEALRAAIMVNDSLKAHAAFVAQVDDGLAAYSDSA